MTSHIVTTTFPTHNDTRTEFYDIFNEQAYAVIIGIIAVVGVLGNSILFLMMFKPSFKKYSFSILLRYMAICDSFVLIQTATEDIIEKFYSSEKLHAILFDHKAPCYLWSFPLDICRFSSPWLLGILGIDRFIAVVFPKVGKKICKRRNAHIITVVVFIASVLLQFDDILCDMETTCYVGEGFCGDHDENEVSFFIWGFFLVTFLPLIVILVFNSITIFIMKKKPEWIKTTVAERDQEVFQRAVFRTTSALVILSLVSFLSLFPKAVVEIVSDEIQQDKHNSYDHDTKLRTIYAWHICNAVMLLYFGQNLYVLLAASPLYRRALRNLFRHEPDDSNEDDYLNLLTYIGLSSADTEPMVALSEGQVTGVSNMTPTQE